jgi:hypothetical protein
MNYLKEEYKDFSKFRKNMVINLYLKRNPSIFIELILKDSKYKGIYLLVDELSKINNDSLRKEVITNLGEVKSEKYNHVIISSLDGNLVRNASTYSQRPVESIYLQSIGDVVKLIVNEDIEELKFIMEKDQVSKKYKYLNILQFIGEVSVTPRICVKILDFLIETSKGNKKIHMNDNKRRNKMMERKMKRK